ncbi:hypothetical protein PM082_009437 [Marasmius tenuissimus]|nr:hypothetical protein PM082_009437 [Marasmius tenuissimus]
MLVMTYLVYWFREDSEICCGKSWFGESHVNPTGKEEDEYGASMVARAALVRLKFPNIIDSI